MNNLIISNKNTLLSILFSFSALLFGLQAQTYTEPGTYTWVVPECVTEVTVKVWGAGGGGGGTSSHQTGTGDDYEACTEGGGGGGGGFAMRTYSVTPGETYTIVVGAGGAAGQGVNNNAAGGNGGDGGTSSFDGPAVAPFGILTGTGGKGGSGASANNTSGYQHIGDNGVGGNGGTGSNGTTNNTGGNGSGGSHSAGCADMSGAGGGAAGPGGNGGNGQFIGPCPHTNPMQGGAGSAPGGNGANGNKGSINANRNIINGNDGLAYGGGASGGHIHLNSWSNQWQKSNGGKGAHGAVILEYDGGEEVETPVIASTVASCLNASTHTITNYNPSTNYQFNPAGPTVGSGGVISNMTDGTSYTVIVQGGCGDEESDPFTYNDALDGPPAPNAEDQDICGNDSTISNLLPNGTGINWYSSASGGSPLSGDTPLQEGTYYVSQTIDGCESDRTPVNVTLSDGPDITIAEDQVINCGSSIEIGTDYEPQEDEPDFDMAPTCQKTSPGQDGPLTQGGGIYNNGVTTSGGTTNINNTNTLVDVGNVNPMGPDAWQTLWYSDFTNHYVEVCPGNSFSITVNGVSLYSNSPYFCQIWVDWNNDGQFTADEVVHNSGPYNSNNFTVNGNITVPTGQSDGQFRMRIRFKDNAPFVPSDNADGCTFQNPVGIPPGYAGYTGNSYGNYYFSDEVEDYTVLVDCNDNSGGGSGELSFEWTPAEGLDDPTISNPTATPEVTTTYTVTITDTENDCVTSQQITITVAGEVETTYEVGECEDNKYDITGEITTPHAPESGDLVIEDCNGSQTIVASAPFNGATSFPFTLTDLDADGEECSLEVYFTEATDCGETVDFTAPESCEDCTNPTLTVEDIHYCDETEIDLNDAIQTNADQAIITFHTSQADADAGINPIANATDLGTYWIRAENSEDEECFTVYEVEVNTTIITYTATTEAENCGAEDGSITLTVEGGNAPYTYSIDGGASSQSENTFTNLAADSYNILITDNNDCQVTGTENVNSIGGPDIDNISFADPTCPNECDGTAEVTASGGTDPYTFEWTNASGDIVGDEQTATQLCAGVYTVEVIDNSGCKTFETVTLTDPDPNSFNLSHTDPTCGNNDGIITISGLTPNGSYDITYNYNETQVSVGGKNANQIGNINLDNLSEGNYSNFIIDDSNGCSMSSDDEVSLVSPEGPNVSAPVDKTICLGESIVLVASNPNNATITWDNGVINGLPFTPTSTGTHTYTVTATTDNCTSTDQVTIFVEAPPEPDFVADVLTGCEPLSVTFTNLTTGTGGDCIWNFGDGNTATGCGSVTHIYENSGTYTVSLTVESSNGCTGTETKLSYIHVTPKPTASFTANPTTVNASNPEVDFFNSSQNGTDFQWNFGDGSPYSNDISPSHTYPDEHGDYEVTLIVSNGDNCTDTARVIIKVEDEIIFYVPNAFTPDNDNYNEVFLPIFTSGFDPLDYKLLIFNRWGEIVFESNDARFGWDGTYGGNIVKDGTYVWKIEFKETMSDKRHTHLGHVTLIR